MRRIYWQEAIGLIALAAILIVWWNTSGSSSDEGNLPAPEINQTLSINETNGVKRIASVEQGRLAVYRDGKWEAAFWGGVNLGSTTPGHYPGELSAKREDYSRWLDQMHAMGIRTVRIYTILPPYFYQALAEFNDQQEEPILLIQGIWSPEEALIGEDQLGRDAYGPAIVEEFVQEIRYAVRAVHGDLVLPKRPGRASGTYSADVADYMLGWILGTEWYPYAVQVTDNAHSGMPPYQGKYFAATAEATPFESWLAKMLDVLGEEESNYGWQHPVAFTNWLTTDPLAHPNEPLEQEDLVTVDPMHIEPTTDWLAGYFAAYHVYPYYPDFLRYQQNYQEYRAKDGSIDPYAGYLRELRDHHEGIPLVVAEFGLPSSRGMAHYGPLGRNQGMHAEQEQAEMNAELMRRIHEENYDGALLFAWQDEWFKFTWNTIGLEVPAERRAFWRNRLTNEEHFGLLAMDPGASPEDQIYIDGDDSDWEDRPKLAEAKYDSFAMSVTHDEAGLNLLLRRSGDESWQSLDEPLLLGFDTIVGGSETVKDYPGVTFPSGQEFVLAFDGRNADLRIQSAYDPHTWLYGAVRNEIPYDPVYEDESNGLFLPWRLALNRGFVLPETGDIQPFEELEVGRLKRGISDPNHPDFNSLADWQTTGGVLEFRIPWMLLGFTDPSSLQVWRYPHQAQAIEPTAIDHIRLTPRLSGSEKPLDYSWQGWDVPQYHERLKAGHDVMERAFKELTVPAR